MGAQTEGLRGSIVRDINKQRRILNKWRPPLEFPPLGQRELGKHHWSRLVSLARGPRGACAEIAFMQGAPID